MRIFSSFKATYIERSRNKRRIHKKLYVIQSEGEESPRNFKRNSEPSSLKNKKTPIYCKNCRNDITLCISSLPLGEDFDEFLIIAKIGHSERSDESIKNSTSF